MAILRRGRRNGGVEYRLGINRYPEPIYGFIACCQRCNGQALSTRCYRTVASYDTYRWYSKRRSLLMAGDDDDENLLGP